MRELFAKKMVILVEKYKVEMDQLNKDINEISSAEKRENLGNMIKLVDNGF